MTTLSKLSQFGPIFQTKVIGALITQKDFLINVSDAIEKEYFENPSHQWIIDETLRYFNKYHTTPSIEFLSIEVKKLENEILKISITETLREAYKASDSKDLEWVESEFTNFCRNQQVKKAILTSVDLLNMGDYDGIRTLVNNSLKAGEEKNMGMDLQKDIESRYREDDRAIKPFPWKTFNDLTQGGPGKGDLVLMFGNPGGGKSWAVVDYGAHLAELGYNVLHYTLELSEGYVGLRYDARFTGIGIDKLKNHRDKVDKVYSRLKGKVIIKGYAPKRASFETLRSHIQQLNIQEDFIPDLIIIDYLDYLRTRARRDRKEEIDDVYVEAKALASEMGCPVISPSQANRSGAKSEIIEGDNAAGSYDKIMIADIILSLARNRKDKVNGTGKWHVMKNRYGGDGLTFGSKMDLSCGKIEIFENPLEDSDNLKDSPKGPDGIDDDDRDILRRKFFERNG